MANEGRPTTNATEFEDDEPFLTVIVCAGPPACCRQGVLTVIAQRADCIWCARTTLYPSGREVTEGPGHA